MPETGVFDPKGDSYHTQNQKSEITQVDRGVCKDMERHEARNEKCIVSRAWEGMRL